MIRVVVDSQLRLPLAELSDEVVGKLISAFTHSNPKHHRLKRINRRAARGVPATIATFDMTERELLLPRGGSQRLRQVLHDCGVPFGFADCRSNGDSSLVASGFPTHLPGGEEHPDWKLWDHQRQAVEAVLRRENCLIRAPTGSGKTTAAIAAIAAAGRPALVIVRNSKLLSQWRRRAAKELPGIKPGIIRGKKLELSPITIAMQQTLWRLSDQTWAEIDQAFGAVVCDEVHMFAAKTCREVVHRIPARYRIGVSADETRRDGCEFLIYDEFGDVELEIDQQRLIDLGIVHDVEVRMLPTEFRADWYVKQRAVMAEALSKGKDIGLSDYKKLIDQLTTDDARCNAALRAAQQLIGEGHQVLMLSERVEHCRRLQSLSVGYRLKPRLAIGGAEHEAESEEALRLLESGEARLVVGTIKAIGCGVDLPSVDCGLVMTPMHSSRQDWGQLRGRLCRTAEGKTAAVIYYLWDRHVFGSKPLEAMRAWNRKVKVLWGGKWINVKEALKRYEAERSRQSTTG